MSRVFTSGRVIAWTSVGVVAARARNTLTLAAADDVKRVHIGMRLRAGVAPEQARPGEFIVHETNEETGTVTVHDGNAVASFAAGDQLFFVAEVELGPRP